MKKRPFLQMFVLVSFLLGIQDGYIALWEEGSTEPLHVFPYRAEMLPPADRAALENGIKIDEKSELFQILEDYLS